MQPIRFFSARILFAILSFISVGCGPIETDTLSMQFDYGSFWEGYKQFSLELSSHQLNWRGDDRDNSSTVSCEPQVLLSSSQERSLVEKLNAITVEGVRPDDVLCGADGPIFRLIITRKPGDRVDRYTDHGNTYVCDPGVYYAPPAQIGAIRQELIKINCVLRD